MARRLPLLARYTVHCVDDPLLLHYDVRPLFVYPCRLERGH